MERNWSQPPEKPGEHSARTLIEKGRADPGFEDLHLAVEGVFASLGYIYQIYREEPGEHRAASLVERCRIDPGFEDAYLAVEIVFKGLGAWVNQEVPDAGEAPGVDLHIPNARSEAMVAFSNRPA